MISGIHVEISTYEGAKKVFSGTAMAYARAIASGNLKLAGDLLDRLIKLSWSITRVISLVWIQVT